MIPFYFEIKEGEHWLADFSRDFYLTYIYQYIAFKTRKTEWVEMSQSYQKTFSEAIKGALEIGEWLANDIQNVELLNAGLGDTPSIISLTTKDKKGASLGGSSTIADQDKGSGTTEQIDILTIDGSVPKDRNISILQLDIEGFEKQALMGALETIKRCKPIIILEDDHGFTKSGWFKDNILSLNYKMDKKLHYNQVILPI